MKTDTYQYLEIKNIANKNEKYLIKYYFPFLRESIFYDNLYYSESEIEITQDKKYFEKYGLDLFLINMVEWKKNAFKKKYNFKINTHKYNLGIIEYIKA